MVDQSSFLCEDLERYLSLFFIFSSSLLLFSSSLLLFFLFPLSNPHPQDPSQETNCWSFCSIFSVSFPVVKTQTRKKPLGRDQGTTKMPKRRMLSKRRLGGKLVL